MERKKVTVPQLLEMKTRGEKITSITAYDYPFAKLVDEAGIDVVFVGDSLGMVVLGYHSTVPVTMEEILHHLRPVARACLHAFVVGDLPFGSYQAGAEEAIRNAVRLMKAGADGVKMEGGGPVIDTVRAVVDAGIPCMGHLGVTPQYISQLGGYKSRGKEVSAAKRLLDDALALERAGAFAIQLECVVAPLSRIITEKLRVPVFGAGCGVDCDGQGLNLYDVLGLFKGFVPKMAKQYASLWDIALEKLKLFAQEIKEKKFPGLEHSFTMPGEELEGLRKLLQEEQKKK